MSDDESPGGGGAAAGQPRGVWRAPGEGERIDVGGVAHLFALTGTETAGALSVERFTIAPGTVGARPHVHHEHDEVFLVLDGELTLHDGSGERVAGPGHLFAAGRGVPHGYRNASDAPATALCLYTPAGYEGYFRDVHAAVGAGEPLTDELLAEFRSRYATTSHP